MTPAPQRKENDLYFLPLGGTGEIGMNLNLYRYKGRWLMVDLGVTFDAEAAPGCDVIMPDIAFIEAERSKLDGLVLTHAHEDHIGAVEYLWHRLRCPIYATPFTAAVLKRKFDESEGRKSFPPINIIPLSGRFDVGPFDLELVSLTHSIPEPNAIAIRTPVGMILHTGDWKIDPEPLVGKDIDIEKLRALGKEGVLALIGDSTNALVEGHSRSEAELRDSLTSVISGCKGRVAVACFASNVARLETMSIIAGRLGRRAALVGRSLWRMYSAAREVGYLRDIPDFIAEEEAGYFPRDSILMICTGSQGEPRAALARISSGSHPHITMERGDTVVFSSRMIPGNEKSINALQNRLASLGIEIITDQEAFVHVSGHPCRDELTAMYQWIRPHIAVPVHGERRHLMAHAELALACQVFAAPILNNGQVLCLTGQKPKIVDEVTTGRLAVDGNRVVSLKDEGLQQRRRLMHNGAAVATIVLNRRGQLKTAPVISFLGATDTENELSTQYTVATEVQQAIENSDPHSLKDDSAIIEITRRVVRRFAREQTGKKPPVEVHVIRL
ncbi:MAG: ribonuclease J [Alphaproteobacteria bacterium]